MVDGMLNASHTLRGTVFNGSELRIVEIDGYKVDIDPSGNLLFFNNEDRPGVLRSVTEVLAAEGINITTLNLGRKDGDMDSGDDLAMAIIGTPADQEEAQRFYSGF